MKKLFLIALGITCSASLYSMGLEGTNGNEFLAESKPNITLEQIRAMESHKLPYQYAYALPSDQRTIREMAKNTPADQLCANLNQALRTPIATRDADFKLNTIHTFLALRYQFDHSNAADDEHKESAQ